MKEYKVYLFDADGTLIETSELIVACYRHTLKHFGYPVPDDETIKSHIGLPLPVQLKYYTGDVSDERIREIWDYYADYQMTVYHENITLCPGTLETLAELKSRGKKLAIVTSRSRWSLDIYLKHLGIYDYFEFTVTPDDVIHAKPDPEPTHFALSRFDAKADEALFIGDAVFDNMSAEAAGVDFALVSWANTAEEKFTNICWKLETMTDLLVSDNCPDPVV